MKNLEKILAIGVLISLILKFSLVSGGDTLALLAVTILAGLYYPLGFLFLNQIRLRHVFKKDSYKNVSALKIILAVVSGLALAIVCIGSLFKLLYLTGANEMLTIGLTFTSIILIVTLILFVKNKDTNSQFILKRLVVIGSVGAILFFLSEFSLVKLQYRNHPGYIEAYAKYLEDPRNEELQRKKELEYYRIILTEEEFKMYENSMNK